MGEIAAKLDAVRRRVAEAAQRVGRDPGSVELVCVSKTRSVAETREAIEAGATSIGENYVQELLQKREALGDAARWHFIGHLQTNKARYLAPFCTLIHGVDSHRLGAEIDKRAAKSGRVQPVLIEVSLAGEDTKFGVHDRDALDLAPRLLELPNIELRGLMTMPPYSQNPEDSRPHFIRLRELRDRLLDAGLPPENCGELSMGMTGDFEVAVEEGATIVRVGTAVFGPRH